MPNKRGVLIKRGSETIRNLINGGLDFEKRLQMIIQGRKEQKQVVIDHKTKIFTAVLCFAMKFGRK